MDNADPLLRLRWRLAETIAWCSAHDPTASPADALRTAELRPAWLGANGDYAFDVSGDDIAMQQERLSDARAELLKQAGMYPDAPASELAGGRLLLSDPQDSDRCGVSVYESAGIIDDYDVPPWDTWFWQLREPVTCRPEYMQRLRAQQKTGQPWFPEMTSFTLCWIPGAYIGLVDEGIQVNPVECFRWGSDVFADYETPLLRIVDAAGLLT